AGLGARRGFRLDLTAGGRQVAPQSGGLVLFLLQRLAHLGELLGLGLLLAGFLQGGWLGLVLATRGTKIARQCFGLVVFLLQRLPGLSEVRIVCERLAGFF